MGARKEKVKRSKSSAWVGRIGIPFLILGLATSAFLLPWKDRGGISAAEWFQGWASIVGAIIGALSALLILSISLVTQNRQHAKQLETQQTLHNEAIRQQESNHREQLDLQRELHAQEMSYVRNQSNLERNVADTVSMEIEISRFFSTFDWWNRDWSEGDSSILDDISRAKERMVDGQVTVRSAVNQWLGSSGVDINTGSKYSSMIFQCIEIYMDASMIELKSLQEGSPEDAKTREQAMRTRDWVVKCTHELFVNMNMSPHEKQSIVLSAVREYYARDGLVRYLKNSDVFDYEPKPWNPSDRPVWPA